MNLFEYIFENKEPKTAELRKNKTVTCSVVDIDKDENDILKTTYRIVPSNFMIYIEKFISNSPNNYGDWYRVDMNGYRFIADGGQVVAKFQTEQGAERCIKTWMDKAQMMEDFVKNHPIRKIPPFKYVDAPPSSDV